MKCFEKKQFSWILVQRKAYRRDQPMQWFRWKRYSPYVEQKFASHAFHTINNMEALTSEYGNELWRGMICKPHHVWGHPEMTSCAVLVKKIEIRHALAFCAGILVSACKELAFYDEDLFREAEYRLMWNRARNVTLLRELAFSKMSKVPCDSNEYKAARLFSLFSNIEESTWRTGMSEFLKYTASVTQKTLHSIPKRVGLMLSDNGIKHSRNAALARFAFARAENEPKSA